MNKTQSPQTYDIRVYLCANYNNCFNYSISYRLNPGAQSQSATNSWISASFPSPQTYPLQAGIVVLGAETAQAVDNKPITISF